MPLRQRLQRPAADSLDRAADSVLDSDLRGGDEGAADGLAHAGAQVGKHVAVLDRLQQVQAGIANDQAELQLDQQKAAERAREFDERMAQQERLTNQKLQASAEREIMRMRVQQQQRRQP